MKGHWMFDCREVSRLVSLSLDRKLPLHQRLGVRFHLSMCRLCSRHRRQLLFIHDFCRLESMEECSELDSATLPPRTAEHLTNLIRERRADTAGSVSDPP